MVKFFQPWCGHCTRMKPDWDQLADTVHKSVFIADVNCSDQADLCAEYGVQGYPTIKYWINGQEHDYSGPRGFEDLSDFVDEELAVNCDITRVVDTCSEKAEGYVVKWKTKAAEDSTVIKQEIDRLKSLSRKSMNGSLKKWIRERLLILGQLKPEEKDL